MRLVDELANRLRFGMKPGLDAMHAACDALGHPERRLRGVIHVAGTNGKGAVCAMLDACLRARGFRVGRYTSPHLVKINERFFLDGVAVDDEQLDDLHLHLQPTISNLQPLSYFEYLTVIAFQLYAKADPDFTILETGLGGRLDATNACHPGLTIITRIGLDHCDWLGDTVEKIAAEKAGIIKPGVPIVLGRNDPAVREVIRARAAEVGAPFHYAPDRASEDELPADFSLPGTFNRENAVTALAALKLLTSAPPRTIVRPDWPGRFQRIGNVIVDGAHNPLAARALAQALADAGFGVNSLNLICGFCGDKDVDEVLRILAPYVLRAFAVQTNNPRSLTAEEMAQRLRHADIRATPCETLAAALAQADRQTTTLITGSLFLVGEALVALGHPPYGESVRFDAAERMKSGAHSASRALAASALCRASMHKSE